MDNPVVKALFLGVAIVLTIGVITWGIATHNKTHPLQKTADSSISTINNNVSNNQYDSLTTKSNSGSDVSSLISTSAAPELNITVKTKADTTGKTYTAASYNLTNVNDPDYIEPTATFTAATSKSTNGTINAITFTQN